MFEANFTNRLLIYGDGAQRRSFIQIDRLCSTLKEIGLTDIAPFTCNLVENTLSIEEIVAELRLLYPSIEMVYANQNMKMRSLIVKPDSRFSELTSIGKRTLGEDLEIFKTKFSF